MAGKFKLSIGEGLLSDVSKEIAVNNFQVVNIQIEKITANEKNAFSIQDIQELKQSILDVGLQQNLVLKPNGNGLYDILSGHRRFQAVTELVEDGSLSWTTVPAVIKEMSDVKLSLSDKAKELYLIATTNVEMRKMTPADCIEAMKMLDVVYDELQVAGEVVGKRREFMAERLGISSRSIQTLKTIDKNLSEEIKEDFINGKMSTSVANQLSKLPEEKQNAFWKNEGNNSIKEKDVVAFTKTKHAEDVRLYDYTIVDERDFNEIQEKVYFSGIDFSKTILKTSQLQKLEKEKAKVLMSLEKINKILVQAQNKYK